MFQSWMQNIIFLPFEKVFKIKPGWKAHSRNPGKKVVKKLFFQLGYGVILENKIKMKKRSFINWNEHRETKNGRIGTNTVLRVKILILILFVLENPTVHTLYWHESWSHIPRMIFEPWLSPAYLPLLWLMLSHGSTRLHCLSTLKTPLKTSCIEIGGSASAWQSEPAGLGASRRSTQLFLSSFGSISQPGHGLSAVEFSWLKKGHIKVALSFLNLATYVISNDLEKLHGTQPCTPWFLE